MIQNLMFEAPHMLKLVKNELIGNNGVPEKGTGFAKEGYVRAAEQQYNVTRGSYWYRFVRPEDPFIGGTTKTYHVTFTTVTEEQIFALGISFNTVPTAEMWVCFGWYCELDLGKAGYLHIKKHGVLKDEIPARIVFRQQRPDFLAINLDRVVFGVQNDELQFITYNGLASDRTGLCFPILYRIAPRAALNLELPPR